MSSSWRRLAVLIGAVALTVSGGGAATAGPGPGPTSGSTASAQPGATAPAPPKPSGPAKPHSVDYRGVQLTVPADWSVVNLDADPTRCMRLDVKAVYLGQPGSQQDCPAHLVGRSETVWLHPASDRESMPTTSGTSKVGALQAHTGKNPTARTKTARFTANGVEADATWGASEAGVDEVLATATSSSQTGTAGPSSSPSSTATPSSSPSSSPSSTASPSSATGPSRTAFAAQPATYSSMSTTSGTAAASPAMMTTSTASGPHTFTGMGFDTCAAPSASAMQSWTASPYRAVGVYIGGSMRACGDGNLSSSWVSQVSSTGWGIIPIYVGLQAPCVYQSGLATITPSQAAAQGRAAADDAANRASYFGLGSRTPVYFDMEAYNNSASGCTSAVLTFLSAWTQELHARGYTSGAYGSTSSLMVDMSQAIGTSFTPPDNVWFARWNGLQTLSDSAAYPAFKDAYWSNGQRLHQYSGDHSETWGGVNISIDSNWVGGGVAGNPVPANYGTGTFGPGSTSFIFTGTMDYWHPNPGQGAQGRAYYTYANGAYEGNGATWSPSLSTGLYAVSAYVPGTQATAVVSYDVTDSTGTTTKSLDQSVLSGWAPLGSYLARNGSSVRVHARDNGPSPTTALVGVDAMRFSLVATAPSAPTSVSAVPDNGRATVRWTAASNNGSPITSYTVTTSPGGAQTTVSGSATSATITGLSNDTAYTFTVRAANIVGSGPTSQPSAPVTPRAFSHLVPVTPTRILDTRYGTTANPANTALAPGAALTIKVAGTTGSPVPAGATMAALNITATQAQAPGYISVDSASTSGTSTANFTPGQNVANLAISRLSSTGTVTVVNRSAGTVQLVADVTGYLSASGSANQWSPTTPTRILDTRSGTTANATRTALAPGAALTIKVAGTTGSPVPAGATAAALNITATQAQSAGYISVDSASTTGTSTANFTPGRNVANLAISRLSSTGTVTVVNHSGGTVQLVADVTGYLTSGSANQWAPITPARILDTRSGTTANPTNTALAPGASLTIKVAGTNGSPVPAGATMAALNITATQAQAAGYIAIDATATTGTSTANFTPGQNVANLAISRLSSAGTVTVVNQSPGTVHLIADVTGFQR